MCYDPRARWSSHASSGYALLSRQAQCTTSLLKHTATYRLCHVPTASAPVPAHAVVQFTARASHSQPWDAEAPGQAPRQPDTCLVDDSEAGRTDGQQGNKRVRHVRTSSDPFEQRLTACDGFALQHHRAQAVSPPAGGCPDDAPCGTWLGRPEASTASSFRQHDDCRRRAALVAGLHVPSAIQGREGETGDSSNADQEEVSSVSCCHRAPLYTHRTLTGLCCAPSRWKRAKLKALLLGQWLSLVKAEKLRLEAAEEKQKADAEVGQGCAAFPAGRWVDHTLLCTGPCHLARRECSIGAACLPRLERQTPLYVSPTSLRLDIPTQHSGAATVCAARWGSARPHATRACASCMSGQQPNRRYARCKFGGKGCLPILCKRDRPDCKQWLNRLGSWRKKLLGSRPSTKHSKKSRTRQRKVTQHCLATRVHCDLMRFNGAAPGRSRLQEHVRRHHVWAVATKAHEAGAHDNCQESPPRVHGRRRGNYHTGALNHHTSPTFVRWPSRPTRCRRFGGRSCLSAPGTSGACGWLPSCR